MNIKKTLIITLFLLCLLMIGAVSASENSTEDVVSSDVNDNKITVSEEITGDTSTIDTSSEVKKGYDNEKDSIEITYDGSFADLSDEINSIPDGGVLNLKKNYKHKDGDAGEIKIDGKKITINGDNHIIDGNNEKGIFECYNSEIVFNNINFYNTHTSSEGGAIYSECYLEINNCSFINNTIRTGYAGSHSKGGAIYSTKNLKISNCLFMANKAEQDYGIGSGASIYCENNLYLYNCTFTNHYCIDEFGYYSIIESKKTYIFNSEFFNNRGNLISYYYDTNLIEIENCIFKNNTGRLIQLSKSMMTDGSSFKLINSTFLDNKYLKSGYSESGSLIFLVKIPDLEISGCNFINNNAHNVIYLSLDKGVIVNCDFSNNQVSTEGVINFEFYNNKDDGSLDIKVIDSIFKNNIPSDFGGEITIKDNVITITSDYALGEIIVTIKNKIYKSSIISKKAKINIVGLPTGDYTAKIVYSGDGTYAPFEISVPIHVEFKEETPNNLAPTTSSNSIKDKNAQTTIQNIKKTTPKIIASKKTFKRKVKVKKYTVTLKQGNKAINKATVTLKVKGKKYTAKTNKKGKATFKIKKLTKKGTYKAVISYKGTKKTVKIIVK